MSSVNFDTARSQAYIDALKLQHAPPPVPPRVDSLSRNWDDEGMELRVKALEDAVKNLPTKTDFAELRADMHKNTIEIQRWMITTVIALFLGFSGLFFTMNNSSKTPASTAAPSQQPIIINVPQAAPAPSREPVK